MKNKRAYSKFINGFRVYSETPFRKDLLPRKVSPLLATYDAMDYGNYLSVDLQTSRLIRAMVCRRDYKVRQEKVGNGRYRVIKEMKT